MINSECLKQSSHIYRVKIVLVSFMATSQIFIAKSTFAILFPFIICELYQLQLNFLLIIDFAENTCSTDFCKDCSHFHSQLNPTHIILIVEKKNLSSPTSYFLLEKNETEKNHTISLTVNLQSRKWNNSEYI